MNGILVLGNQLFHPRFYQQAFLEQTREELGSHSASFFLREDRELASYYRFHQHKIILFFAAMRSFRDELQSLDYQVHYEELSPPASDLGQSQLKKGSGPAYESALSRWMTEHRISKLFCFEIEDKFFEKRIQELCEEKGVELHIWQSPMFLTARSEFQNYLKGKKKPFMKTFYQEQRQRLHLLMERGKPLGGAWSFDSENRLALPKDQIPPALPQPKPTSRVQEVIELVEREFQSHPGKGKDFWLPTDRAGVHHWLKIFIQERLKEFGPYEDAIPAHSDFLYHSVLSPFLNLGLITPKEVIDAVTEAAFTGARKGQLRSEIPLASLEGFIRQIIGWREFIRGIYQNYSSVQEQSNFWNHTHRLKPIWYQGGTGIPPLDCTLRRVIHRGYAHHIERLMVVGSLMVLLEVHPQEAHRWFMEMFVDSSDWVMGPNVYGMALFSDGGIFATKPYICGSNYLRKMSGEKAGEWCLGVDGLYWNFIRKHRDFFSKNPRLSVMVRASEKISPEKWKALERAASELRSKLVEVV